MKNLLALLFICLFAGCSSNYDYDVIIRNGNIYDGSGNKSYKADVAIKGDTIAAIGDLSNSNGKVEVDASGLAVRLVL